MKRSHADSAGGWLKRSSRPRRCATSYRKGNLWSEERGGDAQVFAILEEVDEGSFVVLDAVGVFSHVAQSSDVTKPETVVLFSRSDTCNPAPRHRVLRLHASRHRSQHIDSCRVGGIQTEGDSLRVEIAVCQTIERAT